MRRFFVPKWVRKHDIKYDKFDNVPQATLDRIAKGLNKFKAENPEVSIVIPSYNEEQDLLKTLSSIADIKTNYSVELLIANNNSTDGTQAIIDYFGVRNVFEKTQGISRARQTGLEAAKGKYIISADSDTIYPETWLDAFVEQLKDDNVSCVYGRYSFIPSRPFARFWLAIHELLAETVFKLRNSDLEARNVMGFNSAYRKKDALDVGGYNHNLRREITGRSEDGWIALMLEKRGAIKLVPTIAARAWTSDRRLLHDGGFISAFFKRIGYELKRIYNLSVFGMPDWVKAIEKNYADYDNLDEELFKSLKERLKQFHVDDPEVTIAIPVYNEERDILKTLCSFSHTETIYKTELLVVDNNSTDRTREILNRLNVKVIDQPVQGISFARQAGLEHGKGTYHLNADGDTIYPTGWIDVYVEYLKKPGVACAYGTYSFIPMGNTPRFVLGLYEVISRFLFRIRRKKMDYYNVFGFNFAFRREDAVKVGGFNTKRKRWSDGWMALTLLSLGKIELIKEKRARVWTSDRRLVYDGGLFKAIFKRIKNELERYAELISGQRKKKASDPT